MCCQSPCRIPILFLIHRRPGPTSQVLAALKAAQPTRLLIAGDGPADDERCQQVRQMVLAGIDWPCEVETRFSEVCQGCKRAVSSAIDWAFERHESLIILEDDCVPHQDFFSFCEEMLGRYQNAEEVMQISGSNLTGMQHGEQSYFFSRFGPIWGWASWRRAWRVYDVEMKSWPLMRDSKRLSELCPNPFEASWRRKVLNDVYDGKMDTWDYQWAYAKLACGGLNIVPARNLISNIGFGQDATHTLNAADPRAGLSTCDLPMPLMHPTEISAWKEADAEYLSKVVGLPKNQWSSAGLRHKIKTLLRR